jgi:hypothetical protein
MSDKHITKFEEVKKGSFVRFVDRDSGGRFAYVGEVVVVTASKKNEPAYFEMQTFDGTMGFVYDDKNGFDVELYESASKPKGWAKFIKNPEKFLEAEAPTPVKPTKTKKQQVMELVAANPRKREGGLLTLAKKEIGGTDGQLKTYIRLALTKS